MSIDLTTLITNLQADVDAVDSSTSMSSILSLMHKARKITSISNYYDSAGLLPVDSAYDGMLAFSKADNTMYKFVDSGTDAGTVQAWHPADSAFSSGGGASLPAADMRGTSFGYHMTGSVTDLNKISFTSDGNAADIGDYSIQMFAPVTDTKADNGASGQSSTAGYIFNFYGTAYNPGASPASWARSKAVKYPFANDTIATTNVQMLQSPSPQAIYFGHTNAYGDRTYVYQVGGEDAGSGAKVNIIGKFNSSTDASATDVGDLTAASGRGAGANSSSHSYVMGGHAPSALATYQKFAFASDGNATSVGNMPNYGVSPTRAVYFNMGGQSETKGYSIGGFAPPGINPATKAETLSFPFASDVNMTNLDDKMHTGRWHAVSNSSNTAVYVSGGSTPSDTDAIEKFNVTTEATATDVGNLTSAAHSGQGSAT